jgi:hypothetical protein
MKSLSKRGEIFIFSGILLAVFAIWGGAWWAIDRYVAPPPQQASSPAAVREKASLKTGDTAGPAYEEKASALRGQFGDQFGAVNALFSGFAFAGIIFTILLQRSDLAETRASMSQERFDGTFFQLLNLHMNITEKVATLGGRGKEAFVSFQSLLKGKDPDFYSFCALSKLQRDRIRQIIDNRALRNGEYAELDDADVNNISTALAGGVGTLENFLDDNLGMHERKIVSAYTRAAEERIDDFAHYFRNLYNILKFVDETAQISADEKKRYAKFLRSQLSEAELVVLFYNSIAEINLPGREGLELGYPKMSKLLVKYEVLQNMNPRSLIHPLHKKIFEKNTPKGGGNAS